MNRQNPSEYFPNRADQWISIEATEGLEEYARGMFESSRCRTKVQMLDNGTIEVKFKCLTEGDLDGLYKRIVRD